MQNGPKTIKGIPLDELEDLPHNLEKVRTELQARRSFWTLYRKAIGKHLQENRIKKADPLFKILLFVLLIPQYLSMSLNKTGLNRELAEAEQELMAYYDTPLSKVRRFRLKCERAKALYKNEIELIDEEIQLQTRNLNAKSIGEQTRSEITTLIGEFEERKRRKQNKFEFYLKCEEKLLEIEEQIHVKKSIEHSRHRLKQIEEVQAESTKQMEIEKEFELYAYYGDLLDSISTNLKKLEQDKEEQLEDVEIAMMMRSIKNG